MALEVNKNLSWRDIQNLITRTSDKINPTSTSWLRNGAGLMVSDYFGFGALNAGRLVEAARHPSWVTSKPLHVCKSNSFGFNQKIVSLSPVVIKHNTSSCSGQSNCVTKLEHVRLYITLVSYPRGGVEIELISPSGTRSPILRPRRKDTYADTFRDWGFMALTFWDEDPRGEWTVRIQQTTSRTRDGRLSSLRMEWYGTCGSSTTGSTSTPITATSAKPINTTPGEKTLRSGMHPYLIVLITLICILMTVVLSAALFKISMDYYLRRQQRRQIGQLPQSLQNVAVFSEPSVPNQNERGFSQTHQPHPLNNNRLLRFSETSYDSTNPAFDPQHPELEGKQPPPYSSVVMEGEQ